MKITDKPRKTNPVIALAGNPNTGKTTIFNALCKTRQRTGNYPGVTIERKTGFAVYEEKNFEIVDLPGLYSLNAVSEDEQIAADVIMGRIAEQSPPDLIVFVLDATNLKRNMFLLSQILECERPVIAAITMTDLLQKFGIDIDLQNLASMLKIPVVIFNSRDASSIEHFWKITKIELSKNSIPEQSIQYNEKLRKIVKELQNSLKEEYPVSAFEVENMIVEDLSAIKHRVFADKSLANVSAKVKIAIDKAVQEQVRSSMIITRARYNWIEKITNHVEKKTSAERKDPSKYLDKIFTHKFFGMAAFIGIMYIVFSSIYAWAVPFMDLIEDSIGLLRSVVSSSLAAYPMLQSLVADGMIGGVGSVIVFLPQIIILFIFISVLEDTGYLARAAFLMDKLLGWSGLNGRAFIPMLSSFACAIPGVMSARVMPDIRARITTILISPLMSCSARLPVYLLLISAFIEPEYGAGWASIALLLMHTLGPLLSLPVAWIINKGLLKTPAVPFVLEMPPYRRPHLRNIYYRVYEAAKKFTVRAGTVIFALSIVIWALSYFPHSAEIDANVQTKYKSALWDKAFANENERQAEMKRESASLHLEDSYLGRMGKFVQPVFAPLGYDWKITVGIIGAFPAREVIIATLGIIYNVENDDEGVNLKHKLANEKKPDGKPVYSPLVAISIMVFFALCCQCISTVVTVQRELNSSKWAAFLFFYMTILAYFFALLTYQGGRALGFE